MTEFDWMLLIMGIVSFICGYLLRVLFEDHIFQRGWRCGYQAGIFDITGKSSATQSNSPEPEEVSEQDMKDLQEMMEEYNRNYSHD